MTTSGTIGNTTITTAKLLEKALRRCGLAPQVVTPEIVETAKEDLFMLLMGLSNRGLNLWCVDNKLLPLVPGKKTYVLPVGTTDVLNLLHCTPTQLDYTLQGAVANVSTATHVTRVGVKFSTVPTGSFTFESSNDGLTWNALITITDPVETYVYSWFNVDNSGDNLYYRVVSDGVVSNIFLTNQIREINVTPFNRDDYASQPNKDFQSNFQTNYWFEKLINPQLTVWPVPNDDTRHLSLYRYRQLEDIGSLTEEVAIPLRWYEAICWQLAARLAFEIPGVDAGRLAAVMQMAEKFTIEVEGGETDSSPTFFAPNIGVYTRG